MIIFTLKQERENYWSIVAPSGVKIVENKFIEGIPYFASEWCRAYLSYFSSHTFNVQLIESDIIKE